MSHVSSFQKPSLQTVCGFSGKVSVCHTHFPRCSRAKKSSCGIFPMGCAAFVRIRSRPWRPLGLISEWLPALIFLLCGLFNVYHNGMEWRQETIWKFSPPWCRKYSQTNMNLGTIICWLEGLEHCLMMGSFWSRFWGGKSLSGRWFLDSWILKTGTEVGKWGREGKGVQLLQYILISIYFCGQLCLIHTGELWEAI